MTEAIQSYLNKHGFQQFSPKAVLFDMDGVLINSMPNHAIAWTSAMAKFNITMTAADAYATEGARGVDTIRKMVKEQRGQDIDEAEAQRMYDVKSYEFSQLPKAKVMWGARGLLEKIRRDNLKIIVVTGSGQRPLISRLSQEFRGYITENQIITAYDVKVGKPAPDPYLMGLKKAGNLQPWEAIVVENAPLGIRAGVAAQIFTVAINSGPLPDKTLADAGANIVFPSMIAFSRKWAELISRNPDVKLPTKNSSVNLPPKRTRTSTSHQKRWDYMYNTILEFVSKYEQRPSKHHVEEHAMHNWLKHNKKLLNKEKMPADRIARFIHLLDLIKKYQRINQHAYVDKNRGELSLF